MNAILKNFLSVMVRFKTASILSITGLAVAFASFLIIIMQVEYEWTFDKFHSKSDRIFRVYIPMSIGDKFSAIISRGAADDFFASSPHIEQGTLISLYMGHQYFTVGEGSGRRGFHEVFLTCYPETTRVFDFDMAEGDRDCLSDPDKILIPQSMAHRMFGKESAVGRTVYSEEKLFGKSDLQTFTVGGVYHDFPANTQLDNAIYSGIDNSLAGQWGNINFAGYVVLDNAESQTLVEDHFNQITDFVSHGRPEETLLELVPLTDLYYRPSEIPNLIKTGNRNTTNVLFLVAILVIVIASINFVNFYTALAPIRMKSINTRKVLGSSVTSLRMSLVTEALGMSLVACVAAFFILIGLNKINALSFMAVDTNPLEHISSGIMLVAVSVLVGVISGLYPSYYMTSYPPALALKGNFGLSASGRKLRTALIGFQYVISIGLIICAFFIQMQNQYIKDYDTGYSRDHLAVVYIGNKLYNSSHNQYRQKLREYPGIEDVAFSFQPFGTSDSYSFWELSYKGEKINNSVLRVSWNFLEVMRIPLTEGRYPTESDMLSDSTSYYYFNQRVKDAYNIVAGEKLDPYWLSKDARIMGITDNVKITSLRQGEDNMAFMISPGETLPFSYIRIASGADVPHAVEHIRQTIASIDPSYPFTIEFYDTTMEQLYQKEDSMNKMVTGFSLLAVILSITGVFGLVIFETEYRRKEIGVRKVFGATVMSILLKFNRIYLGILGVCFIVAIPIAYFFVNKWLESFYYRTPIYWWVFIIAFLIVAIITFVTVSFQNWRAATANPIDSIKTE